MSTNYPATSTKLVGLYNISVTVTPLAGTPTATSGHFQVGLTDKAIYQRTSTVSIRATGYQPLDNVTVNLTQGPNPVPTFPTIKKADTSGTVSLTWQTSVATLLGIYSLTMSGMTTPPKTPQDSQPFTVTPTNVTINRLWLNKSSLERSQGLEFRFNATYLDGSLATSGTATIRTTEPNGITTHTVTAFYDPTLQTFRAYYSTTLGSATGAWTGTIDINTFDDGLSNGGPLSPVVTQFNVQPASLAVTEVTYNVTYSPGTTVPIDASILTPGGTSFTQGTVNATIVSFGQKIAGPLGLTYNVSTAEWSGSYKVNASDPTGTWVVTVTASDGYGNNGQSSASLFVTGQSGKNSTQPSFFLTWTFWLLVLALMAAGFGMLILRSGKASHQEVKLDVQAIKRQADQVKGDDFLQSIQAQLKRRADRIAAEKEKHD